MGFLFPFHRKLLSVFYYTHEKFPIGPVCQASVNGAIFKFRPWRKEFGAIRGLRNAGVSARVLLVIYRSRDDSVTDSGGSGAEAGPSSSRFLPVRSRRAALDWSLVLASQGILTTIHRDPESGQWFLELEPEQSRAARKALDLYLREVRDWKELPRLKEQMRLWHPGALLWGLYLVLVYVIDSAQGFGWREAGLMSSEAVQAGEWWRLVTAISLHADGEHLVSNLVSGCLLLGLAMARLGSGTALWCGWLTGIGGNLAGWALYSDTHRGVGASGLVLGCIGLLCVHSLSEYLHNHRFRRYFLSSLGGGVLLFILTGLHPDSDIVAHAGGFVSGCLLGAVLGISRVQDWNGVRLNLVHLILLIALLAGTWYCALW